MPVTSTEISSNYVGNGSTTIPYPITIPRDRDEDLKLLVDGVASTDFTISPDGFRTGVAYANTVALVLYRETPLTQDQPFPSNTTPAPEDVRAGLDKVTLISQENKDGVDRALKAPVGGTPPSGNISQKANTTLGQDASGRLTSRTPNEQIAHLGLSTDAQAATVAAQKVVEAETARDAAEGFKDEAETAKTGAETARTGAETAKTGAETARTGAETARDAAEGFKDEAETAKTGAETARTGAETALAAVNIANAAGHVGFLTKAAMDADLAHDANTLAEVTNDATATNNGVYIKLGASGSGSWQASAYDPEQRITNNEDDISGANQMIAKPLGWLDPFFTGNEIGENYQGKDRWFGAAETQWSKVDNPVYEGKAIRTTSNSTLTGPMIHFDDIGATVGETVTIVMYVVGTGVSARFNALQLTAGGSGVGGQLETAEGTIVTSATPQKLTMTFTIGANATRIRLYPWISSGTGSFDVIALWAFKGSNAHTEPTFYADPTDRFTLSTASTNASAALSTANSIGFLVDVVEGTKTNNLAATGTSGPLTRDLPFKGWAAKYTPAGVSFNAINVKAIGRNPATTDKWRTINVVVRTGTNSHASGATLLAVGSVRVDPNKDSLADVTILLKDPNTGAVVTLSDVSFSNNEYLIGVYALKEDGSDAAMSEWLGSITNYAGNSYYITSSDPKTATWPTFSGNPSLACDHLLITDIEENISAIPTPEFLAGISNEDVFVSWVPPKFYGVVGMETSLYYDNLVADKANKYSFSHTGVDQGKLQEERWTMTPTTTTGGSASLLVRKDNTETVAETLTTTLSIAATSAGTGQTKNVLVIGDSLVNASVITQTLLDLEATDALSLTLHGTRGSGSNKHEGRGGWSWLTYTSDYTDGTYGANPFWHSGAVNFGQYLSTNSIPALDFVCINLGTNDVFSASSDADALNRTVEDFGYAQTLINSIHAANASTKVLLMNIPMPSSSQDAFGSNYNTNYTTARYKRNVAIWNKALVDTFGASEGSNIFIAPTGCNYDGVNNSNKAALAPVNSRSSVQTQRENNGVHPATSGYQQIGDALFAAIKNLL